MFCKIRIFVLVWRTVVLMGFGSTMDDMASYIYLQCIPIEGFYPAFTLLSLWLTVFIHKPCITPLGSTRHTPQHPTKYLPCLFWSHTQSLSPGNNGRIWTLYHRGVCVGRQHYSFSVRPSHKQSNSFGWQSLIKPLSHDLQQLVDVDPQKHPATSRLWSCILIPCRTLLWWDSIRGKCFVIIILCSETHTI